MNRAATLLMAVLAVLAAAGAVYRLPERPTAVRWHFRVAPDSESPSKWGIRWAVTDSLNYSFAEFTSEGAAAADNTYGSMLTLSTGTCRRGRHDISSTRRFFGDTDLMRPGAGISMRLTSSARGTVLETGGTRVMSTQEFELAADSLLVLESYVSGAARVLFDRLDCDSVAAPQYVDTTGLVKRLRVSYDPREGLWTGFDRDTDPLLSRLGGRYALATVACPDGTCLVVYLGGAKEESHAWAPGRIKAVMTPTSIPGVYDLTWIQPDGTPVSDDTGAAFDGHFLTFQFPRWKATLRFRRLSSPAMAGS